MFSEVDAAPGDFLAPSGILTEIQIRGDEGHALEQILPALARLSTARRWLAWVAPPQIPPRPLLASAGVDLSRVLVVRPRAGGDGIWAVEQALRAGTCGAVLAWLAWADADILHRLCAAAKLGRSWGIMFRPEESRCTSARALRQ